MDINVVFLVLTLLVPGQGTGHMLAPVPEGMNKCKYIVQTMVNDERASMDAEKLLPPKDVQPRAKLRVASCHPVKLKVDLMSTKEVF